MSKSTNGFKELKKWFNQDSYTSLGNFNHNDWANQIAKRFFIEDALINKRAAFLNEIMPMLIKAPLAYFDASYRNGSQNRQSTTYTTNTVSPLTFSDISTLYDLSKSQKVDNMTLFDEWNSSNGGSGLGSFAHLRIDLNARNETIESNFRRWLKFYRKSIKLPEMKPHPVNLKLKYADWINYKVIQYFDIRAWCQWSNMFVTKEQILEILFNGGDLSKFKTIEQNLAEVINYKNVMALRNDSRFR
jgi:hypothetical protein